VVEQQGMIALHQIANKQDTLIGIATVDLLNPKKVGFSLKALLLNEGAAFDLTAVETGEQAACVPT
jgi:5-methylcytosine-specific restriction enzyme subunit McrC